MKAKTLKELYTEYDVIQINGVIVYAHKHDKVCKASGCMPHIDDYRGIIKK